VQLGPRGAIVCGPGLITKEEHQTPSRVATAEAHNLAVAGLDTD
jgi:hypothetical protein